MRYIVLVLFLFSALVNGQDSIPERGELRQLDKRVRPLELGKEINKDSTSVYDYKIISFSRDTTFIDTTLTIKKEYKHNYLRKDNFERISFSNVGKLSNSLGVDFNFESIYPSLGAIALHNNYKELQDVTYYSVPKPLTELMFKTTMTKGQLVDAFLTFNTSKQLNFSIGYKGFRSLGKYNYDEAESGNFSFTTNYQSKNKRYNMLAHILTQDIAFEENGGLSDKEVQFESGDSEFMRRIRLDLMFIDAKTEVLGKRYFLDHQFKLINKQKDSTKSLATSIVIGHQFIFETKYSQFEQNAENAYFGNSFIEKTHDKANLKTTYNQLNVEFSNNLLGALKGYVSHYNYNYYFNSTLLTSSGKIDNQLRAGELAIGGAYAKRIGRFNVKGKIDFNITGSLGGNSIYAEANYIFKEKHAIKFALQNESRMPNFNYLLYQSNYENYNWQNTGVFKKQSINSLSFNYSSNTIGDVSVKYSNLNNYTYFKSIATEEQINQGVENAFVKPFQESTSIGYLKVKYKKEFKLGKFALNNTIMYQSVSQSNAVLNVPQLVTRNTLYFSKDVFKGAMFLQTGITFKYFTAYNMNAYNPALGEFYSQDRQKLGAYPMLDFFINARVKQTRLFLKAEHFNSSFTGYDFYAAPNYPYRDFVIRFGIVWNFFS